MANKEPEFNLMINDIMAGDSLLVMRAVVDKCGEVFKGVSSLVDVGGGTGTAARAIAQAFPGLKCAVFDLPHVIAAAPESPLVEAIGGNMFESVPKADAIFLKVSSHKFLKYLLRYFRNLSIHAGTDPGLTSRVTPYKVFNNYK